MKGAVFEGRLWEFTTASRFSPKYLVSLRSVLLIVCVFCVYMFCSFFLWSGERVGGEK